MFATGLANGLYLDPVNGVTVWAVLDGYRYNIPNPDAFNATFGGDSWAKILRAPSFDAAALAAVPERPWAAFGTPVTAPAVAAPLAPAGAVPVPVSIAAPSSALSPLLLIGALGLGALLILRRSS